MDNSTPENQNFNYYDDWEHIQNRSSTSSGAADASEVDNLIFPPSLHQDLTIINNNTIPLSTITPYFDQNPTSPSSSSVSSQPSEPESKAWILSLIYRRLELRLRSKVAKLHSFVGLWKVGIVSALFLTFMWFTSRRWRRRRVVEEETSKLIKLMKEKDRVINNLLLELAHMNEELLGRRSVPVHRVH